MIKPPFGKDFFHMVSKHLTQIQELTNIWPTKIMTPPNECSLKGAISKGKACLPTSILSGDMLVFVVGSCFFSVWETVCVLSGCRICSNTRL